MMKTSIVIPVYNVEKYLSKCLDSLLMQTYHDFEIILVDDGSPDESGKICDTYSERDARVRVIHQENQGAGPARNAGIKAANGEYIMFTDADDWAEPQMLEKSVCTMEEDNCDLLMFANRAVRFNKDETKVISTDEWIPKAAKYNTAEECHEIFSHLYFKTSFNTPWNKMYRMDIIKEYDIKFPSLRRSQDSVFNMEYYKHISSLSIIEDVLYNFRLNSDEKIWKKFPKDIFLCDSYCDEYIVSMLSEWGKYEGKTKEMIDDKFINMIYWAVGFYRNPYWKLNSKERKEYILSIVNHDYVEKRLSGISGSSPFMEKKRQPLVSKDVKGIIKQFRKSHRINRFFDSRLYKVLSWIKHKLF